jgi:hypothetical protein
MNGRNLKNASKDKITAKLQLVAATNYMPYPTKFTSQLKGRAQKCSRRFLSHKYRYAVYKLFYPLQAIGYKPIVVQGFWPGMVMKF